MIFIWNAYQYIKAHRFIYLLFVLQLALVIFSLNFSFSLTKSLSNLTTKYEDQQQLNTIYVEHLMTNEQLFQDFTSSTLNTLQSEIPSLHFALAKSSILALFDSEQFHQFYYYEVAGDFGEIAISDYSQQEIATQIFAPKSFLTQLQQTLTQFPNFLVEQGFQITGVSVEDSTLTLTSGEVVHVKSPEVLSTSQDATILFNHATTLRSLEENIHLLNHAIIVPAKFNVCQQNDISRSIGFDPSGLSGEKLNQLVLFLKEHFPEYPFTLRSVRQELAQKEHEVVGISRAIFVLSLIVLLIVLIGLIGFIATLVERRKHNISLSLVIGATRTMMLQELFYEIFLVLLISCIIGTLSFYGYSIVHPIVFGVAFYPNGLVSIGLIIGQGIIAWILTMILVHKYVTLDPVTLLREV